MKFSTLSIAAVGFQGASAATIRGERKTAVMYYPRYTGDFATGWCSTTNAYAQGSMGYSTELACCNAAFAGQASGKCLSMLPAPPTVSPTATGGPDAWYANYDVDFAQGYCINKMPAPSGRTIYTSELLCCKGAYATQTTGACLKSLPDPPTVSPTITGGPNVWYANFNVDFAQGYCINKMPVPNGRVTYTSELLCCKGAYATQTTGACLKSLPDPPTVSPTITGGPNVWYPDYADFNVGTCINKMPVPNGRQTYDSELKCCKGFYAAQTSGACLKSLPDPPTVSPTITGGPNVWYPDFTLGWTNGACTNKMPVPSGRNTYTSELLCCKGAYPAQESGACLKSLPDPPTVSPTITGGPNVWYPDYADWNVGTCINKMPVPSGRQTYDSELKCCKGFYAAQTSGACLKSLPDPPTVSPTITGGPNVWYPNYDVDAAIGYCINKMPVPNGRVTYTSELLCCKGSYAGQTSGACLKSLPDPPTVSPTITGGPNVWYSDNKEWSKGTCINKMPVPVGRQTYTSELACCKGYYGTQSSGACLAALPSPPTVSPISAATATFFPIWSGWETGHCDNDPTKRTSGNSYKYVTQKECCDAWFSQQKSGACMRFDPTYGSRSPTQAPIQ
jgi:hypothetical protein